VYWTEGSALAEILPPYLASKPQYKRLQLLLKRSWAFLKLEIQSYESSGDLSNDRLLFHGAPLYEVSQGSTFSAEDIHKTNKLSQYKP
jgi:hypothetical protein